MNIKKPLKREIIKENHIKSRRIIREKDENAKIYATFPAFGSVESAAGYTMPTTKQMAEVFELLFLDEEIQTAGTIDGVIFQSWEAPTLNKIQNQETLKDLPARDDRIKLIKQFCSI